MTTPTEFVRARMGAEKIGTTEQPFSPRGKVLGGVPHIEKMQAAWNLVSGG